MVLKKDAHFFIGDFGEVSSKLESESVPGEFDA